MTEDYRCEKCGLEVTTGAMALFCPKGRECAFIEDDEHFSQVEQCREDWGINRDAEAS